MDPSELADQLRRACETVFADEPVVAAYLHGSAASGRTGPFSDVDVALLLEEPCEDPLGESVRLGGLLAEHAQVSDLDVRSLNGADLRFQGRVVQDGVVIHGQDSPAAWRSRCGPSSGIWTSSTTRDHGERSCCSRERVGLQRMGALDE